MEKSLVLENSLDFNSDIPLYTQLSTLLRRAISAGTLAPGALLPSEAELCRTLDISRNTVRQAIGDLETAGLVIRKRGKGTFVTDPASRRKSGVQYSFTTEVRAMGKDPSSTLIDFNVIDPSRDVAEMLHLRRETKVYCFTRVRKVNGKPIILETSYYPVYIYPNLTRELLESHSFYSLLYHVGIAPFSAKESYEAVILSPNEAELLGCTAGSPALFHRRVTSAEGGSVYEYTCSYMRADSIRLDVDLQKTGAVFSRTIR
ncbi:MAG: GntR family transcriptional regulator [Oscillospiraceae bacterium]|nr:GntR family transcriptional regulator [Oscillospiraceae bacterium]